MEKGKTSVAQSPSAPEGRSFRLARVTSVAHALVRSVVRPGDHVVDATVGNGHDTLRLARWAGPTGRVDGFDVQAEALRRTRDRLDAESGLAEVVLHERGHEDMHAVLPAPDGGGLAAVMFNLGYLPGGDRRLTTRPETTCAALGQALERLRPGGILTVVAYLLHDGGQAEAEAVLAWADGLDPVVADVLDVRVRSSDRAPFLLALQHRSSRTRTESKGHG